MDQKQLVYVYLNEQFVGELSREGDNYYFEYDDSYLLEENFPLSQSLPKEQKTFTSSKLFSFFEGLLSEGWLKKIQQRQQKIDEKDSYTQLAKNGAELIGAVSIRGDKL